MEQRGDNPNRKNILPACAIILAGGTGRRMGQDKGLLPIGSSILIEHILTQLKPHFEEILISSNTPDRYRHLNLPIVTDPEQGRGPLMGLATALRASTQDLNFVMACDIPTVDLVLVQQLYDALADYDAVIPCIPPSHYEPLFAVYHKRICHALETALATGPYKAQDAVLSQHVRRIELSQQQQQSLHNLNTPEDYQRFLEAHDAP